MNFARTQRLAALLVVLLTAPLFAQEAGEASPVEFGAKLAIFSHNASRGDVVSNQPVLQPEFWVTSGPFTFNSWTNVDLTDDIFDPWHLTETDWTLSYDFTLLDVECSLGYVYYTFPTWHTDDTQEVFFTAAFDVPLSPSFEIYYDFDEVGGAYTAASVSHSLPISSDVADDSPSLDLSLMLGYGDSSYIGGCFDPVGGGLVDLVASCEFPFELPGGLVVTPSVSWLQVLDSELRECTDKSEALYTGLSVEKTF